MEYEVDDTVEVTFQGKVFENHIGIKKIELAPYHYLDLDSKEITSVRVVEKAKKPVYTNSDATDFEPGDIYYFNFEEKKRCVILIDIQGTHRYVSNSNAIGGGFTHWCRSLSDGKRVLISRNGSIV